jgi:inner membrane protein involved in colicin E2 resistance
MEYIPHMTTTTSFGLRLLPCVTLVDYLLYAVTVVAALAVLLGSLFIFFAIIIETGRVIRNIIKIILNGP